MGGGLAIRRRLQDWLRRDEGAQIPGREIERRDMRGKVEGKMKEQRGVKIFIVRESDESTKLKRNRIKSKVVISVIFTKTYIIYYLLFIIYCLLFIIYYL